MPRYTITHLPTGQQVSVDADQEPQNEEEVQKLFTGAPPAPPTGAGLPLNNLKIAMQGRVNRHNQNLPPEVRGSQVNQDLDHYLVGNEMAGPQYPLWQRLGAAVPAVGHELLRPLISASPTVEGALNKVFGSPDQPVWIRQGPGAGGAAAEPPPSLAGALRNLQMLYRGATGGALPQQGD